MEYMLRGGTSGLDLYCNGPTWANGYVEGPEAWLVLVDGKQRLDAALGFLSNEFPIFPGVEAGHGLFRGYYFRDFSDNPHVVHSNFRWHVNTLKTRQECLQWYLEINAAGTPHTAEELAKVRILLQENKPYVRPSQKVIEANAELDRAVIRRVIAKEKERERHIVEVASHGPTLSTKRKKR